MNVITSSLHAGSSVRYHHPQNGQDLSLPKCIRSIRAFLGLLLFVQLFSASPIQPVQAASIDLTGSTANWKVVRFGGANQFDYPSDTQAGAGDLDLVGDSNHPVLYTQFDDNGTANDTSDDKVGFRVRIGNPGDKNSASFSGQVLIGMDANADGKIDLFVGADGTGNASVVSLK